MSRSNVTLCIFGDQPRLCDKTCTCLRAATTLQQLQAPIKPKHYGPPDSLGWCRAYIPRSTS